VDDDSRVEIAWRRPRHCPCSPAAPPVLEPVKVAEVNAELEESSADRTSSDRVANP